MCKMVIGIVISAHKLSSDYRDGQIVARRVAERLCLDWISPPT